MSQHTPDSWIERNPDDDGRPPMTDAEMCEEGVCDHAGHCDVCERPTNYPLEDGICVACSIAWLASRQLGYTPPRKRRLVFLSPVSNPEFHKRFVDGLEERRYEDAKLRERLDSATDRADSLGGITTTEARAVLLREITEDP